jgi:hypothetical protein
MHLIQEKSETFWRSIDSKIAPKINYEKDSEFITKLYSHAEPNKILDAKEDAALAGLVSSYRDISSKIKELETEKDAFKAKILQHIDDAEKVIGNDWSISAGITPETQLAFTRKSFRNFKINTRGQRNV